MCYITIVANNGVWLSLVERFVRDEEVAWSNLVTPTNRTAGRKTGGLFLFYHRRHDVIRIRIVSA